MKINFPPLFLGATYFINSKYLLDSSVPEWNKNKVGFFLWNTAYTAISSNSINTPIELESIKVLISPLLNSGLL